MKVFGKCCYATAVNWGFCVVQYSLLCFIFGELRTRTSLTPCYCCDMVSPKLLYFFYLHALMAYTFKFESTWYYQRTYNRPGSGSVDSKVLTTCHSLPIIYDSLYLFQQLKQMAHGAPDLTDLLAVIEEPTVVPPLHQISSGQSGNLQMQIGAPGFFSPPNLPFPTELNTQPQLSQIPELDHGEYSACSKIG